LAGGRRASEAKSGLTSEAEEASGRLTGLTAPWQQENERGYTDMPHSVPVSKLMIPRNEWPQLRADVDVITAIKILRIVTEDRKLEHGHSTPLVFDENYNLLGFVHLIDLLKSVRQIWERPGVRGEVISTGVQVRDLAVPFEGAVTEEESIIKALDIMMEYGVSMVPVMKDGKLAGVVKLADAFNEVAALLFDEEDPTERHRLLRDYHF